MNTDTYLSFIDQTLHYFDRPHEAPVTATLRCEAAWRGDDLPALDQMAYHLDNTEQEEILQAIAAAESLEKPTRELVAAEFPLPRLVRRFANWQHELMRGRGFVVIRGVPTEAMTQNQRELFFWCFGLHLGKPGEQNPQHDLLGHVIDTGAAAQDAATRLYKTSANIAYHCDAADVVGLLCVNKAKAGGESRIASSVSVFNRLLEEDPELARRLFDPVLLDIRDREVNSEGSTLPIPPCRYANGTLRTFYHSDYFRSVTRHDDVKDIGALEQRLFDHYEAIANSDGMYLDMDLQPGDIQLLSNHSCLHARTDYQDHPEPERRRHLLRLWLSLPGQD